jgi:hypothetical protein
MRLDLTSEFPLLAVYALMGLVRRPLAGCESPIRRRLSSGWNARHVVKRRLSSSLSGPERVQARWHHDVLTVIHPELLVLNRVLQGVARGTQAVLAETRDALPLFIFVQLAKMLVRRRPLR